MKFDLSPEKTLGAVQSEFAESFPGLKLAFFTKPHHAFKGSAAKFLIQEPKKSLGDLSEDMKSGYLVLEHQMPTWQVERLFEEEFGLHVQVFRRSGNIWLETSVSDNLTLEEQQSKAQSSDHIHQEFVDPMDYREQD